MWHTIDKPEVFIYDLFVSMPALMSPMPMVGITAPWGFLLLLGKTRMRQLGVCIKQKWA
jgi:hypothetical protein